MTRLWETPLYEYVRAWERNDLLQTLEVTTSKHYRLRTERFLKWCLKNKIDPLTLTMKDVDKYVTHLRSTAGSSAIKTYLVSIQRFYHYLQWFKEVIDYNPITDYCEIYKHHLRRRVPKQHHPKADLSDTRKLAFEAFDPKIRIASALLLECGLRPSELLGIDIEHINLTDESKVITVTFARNNHKPIEQAVEIYPYSIYILHAKGNVPRQVILIGPIRQMLKEFLAWRTTQPVVDSSLLFNLHGHRLNEGGLRKRFCDACEALNIRSGVSKGYQKRGHRIGEKAIYPRQLRPLFRSEMSMRGMNEKIIDLQMGHKGEGTGRQVYDQRTYEERLTEHNRVGCLLV